MYQIKQENENFVVYCKGKEIERFSSEKEAKEFLYKETEYSIPSDDKNSFSIIE